MTTQPYFLITIDTEGDNLWARPRHIETRNAGFLPRFQSLCERFGFKPTYLTDYEMAVCPVFRSFAESALARGACETGMHLHPQNTPPGHDLTGDDLRHQPYLMEYPDAAMEAMIESMTHLLEKNFGARPISHRAGRWGLDARYARLLARHGYRCDCSVTPYVSWQRYPGVPGGRGGMDFSAYPQEAYWMDPADPARPGKSGLLQAPMTIRPRPGLANLARRTLNAAGAARWRGRPFLQEVDWLRPNGHNLEAMLRLAAQVRLEGADYLEFMLHSSEFMPGGSPVFPRPEDIEKLYRELEVLFSRLAEFCRGATLSEFFLYKSGSCPASMRGNQNETGESA